MSLVGERPILICNRVDGRGSGQWGYFLGCGLVGCVPAWLNGCLDSCWLAACMTCWLVASPSAGLPRWLAGQAGRQPL